MASISPVVINNSVPTAKTFNPTDCTTSSAVWHDRSLGIDIGFPSVKLSVKRLKAVNRIHVSIAVPTLEVISGADGGYTPSPKVAYVSVANIELLLPIRSTLLERQTIEAFTKNILSNAHVVSAIENLDRPY